MDTTFPPHLRSSDGDRRADLICPNCGGSIRLRAEGSQDTLVFHCMVGHMYTLDDFLIGKEEHIEEIMWATIYAYEELAAFLRDLAERRPRDAGAAEDARARRQRQAEAMAARLRELFEEDHRISLKPGIEDESGQALG